MNESNPTAQTFRDILPVMLGELLLTGIMLGVYALIGKFSAKVLWGALLGAGAGVGAGFSCFLLANLLMPFTKRNTQNAMMTKSMRFWMKLP